MSVYACKYVLKQNYVQTQSQHELYRFPAIITNTASGISDTLGSFEIAFIDILHCLKVLAVFAFFPLAIPNCIWYDLKVTYDQKKKKINVYVMASFFQLVWRYTECQGQEGIAHLETKAFIKGFGMPANSFSIASCLIRSAGNDN